MNSESIFNQLQESKTTVVVCIDLHNGYFCTNHNTGTNNPNHVPVSGNPEVIKPENLLTYNEVKSILSSDETICKNCPFRCGFDTYPQIASFGCTLLPDAESLKYKALNIKRIDCPFN